MAQQEDSLAGSLTDSMIEDICKMGSINFCAFIMTLLYTQAMKHTRAGPLLILMRKGRKISYPYVKENL